MKRLAWGAFVLSLVMGCASQDRPAWLNDAVDDWNGENMKMSDSLKEQSRAKSRPIPPINTDGW